MKGGAHQINRKYPNPQAFLLLSDPRKSASLSLVLDRKGRGQFLTGIRDAQSTDQIRTAGLFERTIRVQPTMGVCCCVPSLAGPGSSLNLSTVDIKSEEEARRPRLGAAAIPGVSDTGVDS